jgi:hypothetical protein
MNSVTKEIKINTTRPVTASKKPILSTATQSKVTKKPILAQPKEEAPSLPKTESLPKTFKKSVTMKEKPRKIEKEDPGDGRDECSCCGRWFNPDSLERHY